MVLDIIPIEVIILTAEVIVNRAETGMVVIDLSNIVNSNLILTVIAVREEWEYYRLVWKRRFNGGPIGLTRVAIDVAL